MAFLKRGLALLSVCLLASAAAWATQAKPAAKHPAQAAAKPKKPAIHRAIGEIVSVSDTQLVLSHGRGKAKKETTFTLTSETKKQGELAQGERAAVYYRSEKGKLTATRVTVLPKAKAKPAKAKPKVKAKPKGA